MGCRLWGCTESDTAEATQQQQQGTKLDTEFCLQRDQMSSFKFMVIISHWIKRKSQQARYCLRKGGQVVVSFSGMSDNAQRDGQCQS